MESTQVVLINIDLLSYYNLFYKILYKMTPSLKHIYNKRLLTTWSDRCLKVYQYSACSELYDQESR